MSHENKIFNLSRNAKGDLVFEVNPPIIGITSVIKAFLSLLLKILLPLFSFFDFLASKKKLVISSVGLGIGLGLSVLVTQRPDTLQAFPTLALSDSTNIYVNRLIIPKIDLSSEVATGNVQDIFENVIIDTLIHDERSSELGGLQPVVVTQVGLADILGNLEDLEIGDEIQVQGTNNAFYLFKIIEIRDMKSEYLPNVIGVNEDSLIVYKSKNVLRTRLYMVIARPVR